MELENDEKHANEIRMLIEECEHQMTFLTQSQESLREALLECPDDPDFKQALDENTIILVDKGIRIVGLKKSLCRVDAAYREENRRAAIILQERHSNVPSGALVSRIYGHEPGDSDDELIPIDEIGVNGSRSWESERVVELISSSPQSTPNIRNNVITNDSNNGSNNVRNNNTESERTVDRYLIAFASRPFPSKRARNTFSHRRP